MNKQRKKIALLLNWRKSWMGGIIYIVNLINVLNLLDDEDKPEILLFFKSDLREFTEEIHYPYLQCIEWEFMNYRKAYILSWLSGTNYFVKDIIELYRPNGIYPLNDWPVSNRYFEKSEVRVVSWFPDLQHKFYPHFFTRVRVFLREMRIKLILRHTKDLAVSSEDVRHHFEKFYRLRKDLKIHILKFVTILPKVGFKRLPELMKTYQVPSKYYIVSNQFTNHKNHPLLLEAMHILKKKGATPHMVFTGKTEFKGNEAYIAKIREMVKGYGLEDHVHLLGVVPRMDQLSLMKESVAVIQPSFFEGWSTVIEDAKTLYVPVIAANLAVNMEQLGNTGIFFDPNKASELANLLEDYEPDGRHLLYAPFEERAKKFAEDFLKMFG